MGLGEDMTGDKYSIQPRRDECGLSDIQLLDRGLASDQLGAEDRTMFTRLRGYISGRKRSQSGHTMPRNVSGRCLSAARRAWVYRIVASLYDDMDKQEVCSLNVGVLHKY